MNNQIFDGPLNFAEANDSYDWDVVVAGTGDLTLTDVIDKGETYAFEDHPLWGGKVLFIVGDGASDLEALADLAVTSNPRLMIEGRVDAEEVTGTISSAGWHTIGEVDDLNNNSAAGFVSVVTGSGGGRVCRFGIRPSTGVRNHENTDIEMFDNYDLGTADDVIGFRWAKSDSSATAGAKLQANIVSSETRLTTQMWGNLSRDSVRTGMRLVSPYLDATPTLPDGVTAGTFLEAGEEFSLEGYTSNLVPGLVARKSSNDTVRCTLHMPQVPKTGTGLTITLPATVLRFYDGAGNTGTVSGAHSVSNFVNLPENRIAFFINETGAFTSMIDAPASLLISGAGGKFTIT